MSTPVPDARADAGDAPWARYEPLPNVPDELLDAAGRPRPHAARFGRSAMALGRDELTRRWDRAQRELRENGVTYNV